MEDKYFLWFSILLSLIVLLMLNLVKKIFKSDQITSDLPPGPWKLPIFGSIHHLFGSLPHHKLRELSKKYGPIMHLQLGETSTIVISSKEIAQEVLKTNDLKFAQRYRFIGAEIVTYGCTNLVFSPYGDYWKELRKICTLELLSTNRVRSFQSIRKEEVSNFIKNISSNTGSKINLSHEILSLSYNIISRAAFGDKCKEQEAFTTFIKETAKMAESFSFTNLFPSQHWLHVISGMIVKLRKIHKTGDEILEKIINNATTKTGGDGSLLSYLLNLNIHASPNRDGFHLTTNNIKAVIQDIFFAGSGTSATTLEWAFSEMLKNPRVLKKAQAEVRHVVGSKGYVDEINLQELKYLKAVIKETLRLHPPGPLLIPRECIENCVVNGYIIPAGTQVLVNAWAIGRDPKYWNEGEKFNPERFIDCPIDYKGSNFEFIPFGAGRRMCPGILFAEVGMEFPLAQLLYYFDWGLPSGTSHENLDMTEALGSEAKRKNDLFVIPISYNSVSLD
ncbi:putative premnaspirodiene oxygenase [Medicago truncatula]|uniref:Cytochrome P450 family 71 protein n=1 Tax=Medicago truncatula TaxID=3880 RepID=A0A072U7W3_MEDTR|nr:desmethyl-deoxy-podophyllotoxin synthase [Medicago truncatula]KEH25844.1 cytochrome P450 family 71 protein [Medicago truncatula]RHN51016.1 putative premnaspirodiene oxygenase [Medicago truncatula]